MHAWALKAPDAVPAVPCQEAGGKLGGLDLQQQLQLRRPIERPASGSVGYWPIWICVAGAAIRVVITWVRVRGCLFVCYCSTSGLPLPGFKWVAKGSLKDPVGIQRGAKGQPGVQGVSRDSGILLEDLPLLLCLPQCLQHPLDVILQLPHLLQQAGDVLPVSLSSVLLPGEARI